MCILYNVFFIRVQNQLCIIDIIYRVENQLCIMYIMYRVANQLCIMYIMYTVQGREPTIEPVKQGECQLGQREGFSDTDIRKLNTLYQVNF